METKLLVIARVRDEEIVNAPVEVEAKNGDPSEGANYNEVEEVAKNNACVVLYEATNSGWVGTIKVEGCWVGEIGGNEEYRKEWSENYVDKNNSTLKMMVAWDKPVSEKSEEETKQADGHAD